MIDLPVSSSQPEPRPDGPLAEFAHLDTLWFQVAGTRCNLTCHHCFISCSPHNRNFEFLTYGQVEQGVQQGLKQGVREFYFTGGEPFLNPDIRAMLQLTLQHGATTVLTNGTVMKPDWLQELKAYQAESRYSLEFRVSIDGPTPERNDPIRGKGTFVRAMSGVEQLCEAGFLPIITMTRTWEDHEDQPILDAFRRTLAKHGCTRPRLKILPRLQIGAEAKRTQGYEQEDRVTELMMQGYDVTQLICHNSRVVTNKGVYVCPILIDSPGARMGASVEESLEAFPLGYAACSTCYQYGAICSNAATQSRQMTSS